MATREEYNSCMRPYMTGSKPKEQRQRDFCVGAKVCSGKAKTEEEAVAICNIPKLPKWAKELIPKGEKPTCPIEGKQIQENLDLLMLKAREGEAEEARQLAAQTLNSIITCRAKDTVICELAVDAMQDFNDMSKRHYLTGETKDLKKKFDLIKEIL